MKFFISVLILLQVVGKAYRSRFTRDVATIHTATHNRKSTSQYLMDTMVDFASCFFCPDVDNVLVSLCIVARVYL